MRLSCITFIDKTTGEKRFARVDDEVRALLGYAANAGKLCMEFELIAFALSLTNNERHTAKLDELEQDFLSSLDINNPDDAVHAERLKKVFTHIKEKYTTSAWCER